MKSRERKLRNIKTRLKEDIYGIKISKFKVPQSIQWFFDVIILIQSW